MGRDQLLALRDTVVLVSRKLSTAYQERLAYVQKLQTSLAMSRTRSKGGPARITLVVLARAKIATESTSMLSTVFSFSVAHPDMSTRTGR